MAMIRRTQQQVEAIQERLEFVYPTEREIREQLDAELDSILAPGGSIRVFADDAL